MVYRGKPSAACAECRKRRNRCDQAIPACGQCIKARRACSGYRNGVDLMFLDESTSVAKKSRPRTSTSADSPLEDGARAGNLIAASKRAVSIQLSDVVFYQSLDELGINFFMRTYVGNDGLNSQLDYLPDLYLRYGSSQSIQTTVKAVGLAGYARACRRPQLLHSATKSYISAIKDVNRTLSDPESTMQDSTLASVLLLAMYEVMVMPRSLGLQNLTKHLNGATSIAALYIKQQRQTEYARRLMGTVFQCVIMNCWIQGTDIPNELYVIKDYLGWTRHRNPPSLHSDFLDIIALLIEFRQALTENRFDSPNTIIDRAIALDYRVKAFSDNMPEEGQFRNVHKFMAPHLAFNGYYHIYPKNFTAHFWNNVRSARMRLHSLIRNQCSLLIALPTYDDGLYVNLMAQLEISELVIQSLAQEICASVPQLAGYLDQLPPSPLDSQRQPDATNMFNDIPTSAYIQAPTIIDMNGSIQHDPPATTTPEPPQAVPALPIPRPSSKYHLLYMLHMLSSVTILPKDLKHWMQERIQWIEGISDPEELLLLRAMLRRMPSGVFPFFLNI